MRNALGVIGENHNILSKKSTNRDNFDLLSRCLVFFFIFVFIYLFFNSSAR